MHLDLYLGLILLVPLSLLLSITHSTAVQPASPPSSEPQAFACRGLLPPWGESYGSWGLFRNPSIELNPGQTGEILDLQDLCSRREQIVPIRLPDFLIYSTSTLQDDHLLYGGHCVNGWAEFITVTPLEWKRLARIFLFSLGEESIDALWNGRQRVEMLCRGSCFCQFSRAFQNRQRRIQKQVRDSQRGESQDTSWRPDSVARKTPYRDYFERPYGPFWPGQGPVLSRNGEQAGVCSAVSREDFALDLGGRPEDPNALSWVDRKQALRQLVRCMADNRAGSIGG
jgi:hypothetical protein